ncbi:Vacuolar protein sorting 55 family protein [Prunus dulcis]|uniref:Vacuolar protein sorting 55 family protein n=1 Tax=Prunus dulcis TaxID=3755 RepID=A0A4Y1RG73_PRUDU|nr:Vacuolar protein sorting 55 family protein [Prunus dulcis]
MTTWKGISVYLSYLTRPIQTPPPLRVSFRGKLKVSGSHLRFASDLPGYMRACLHTGKLAALAILVSGGIVLQILACALYNNWWPMLTIIMYVLLPMPLLFFVGSDSSVLSESDNGWVNATKFLTGASAIGSIAIPAILKHAGVIGWGAMAMELASFFVFVLAIMCYIRTSDEDSYIYKTASGEYSSIGRALPSPLMLAETLTCMCHMQRLRVYLHKIKQKGSSSKDQNKI